MPTNVLEEPCSLGAGRSICPPRGWPMAGSAGDDPLRLQPNSVVEFRPDGQTNASITWRIASWLVGRPEFVDFEVLLTTERPIPAEQLAPLYPLLIKFPPAHIRRAQIARLPFGGRVLSVSYFIPDSGWAGEVLYAPTLEVAGEVQLLSYQGIEPGYSAHLEIATESLKTFKDERLISRA